MNLESTTIFFSHFSDDKSGQNAEQDGFCRPNDEVAEDVRTGSLLRPPWEWNARSLLFQ